MKTLAIEDVYFEGIISLEKKRGVCKTVENSLSAAKAFPLSG